MSQVYPSPYFFHSKALQKLDYVTIELQKVYRQKDAEFLEILNAVRENRATESVLLTLNSRLHAYEDDGETIRLTTHNSQADSFNSMKLEELPGKLRQFEADVQGDFPENTYPADYVLSLKVGAQVMFVRNDPDGAYYNGKIGKVTAINSNASVEVECSDGTTVSVCPVEWENLQYGLNEDGEIMPEVVGTFRQLPLRVAWAITIHKSQGLTFDRVIIDASAAFAFGQVYVALSRCHSLEGISLESLIRASGICSDADVASFNSAIPSVETVSGDLPEEERRYQYDTICEMFRLDEAVKLLDRYRVSWSGTVEKVYGSEYAGLMSRTQVLEDARAVAMRFEKQLKYIRMTHMSEEFLNERLLKASEYFLPILEEVYEFVSRCSRLSIDNKDVKAKAKEISEQLLICLDIKCRAMTSVKEGRFTVDEYARIRTECNLEERKVRKTSPKVKLEAVPGSVNEELRERLMQWRMDRFKKDNVPAYTIMHQSTLMAIASIIPHTKEQLLAIKGFGEATYKKYGEEILAITSEY